MIISPKQGSSHNESNSPAQPLQYRIIEAMIAEGKKLNEQAYSPGQEGGRDAPKERDPVLQHLKNTNFTTLPTRSTAGTRFAYWLENHSDPKTKKRYAAAPNNKAKEQIRLEWAKAEFDKEEKLFQETKSWSRVDSTHRRVFAARHGLR